MIVCFPPFLGPDRPKSTGVNLSPPHTHKQTQNKLDQRPFKIWFTTNISKVHVLNFYSTI